VLAVENAGANTLPRRKPETNQVFQFVAPAKDVENVMVTAENLQRVEIFNCAR
jgi:hypothetical protein